MSAKHLTRGRRPPGADACGNDPRPGAGSIAAGEYVSVSSQADTETADIERERDELQNDPKGEKRELAKIYESRGLDPELAQQVAEQLMAKDALVSHTRDELGFSEGTSPHPIQAALSSALAYATGVSLPLLTTFLAPQFTLILVISVSTLMFLALLGTLAAYVGGASMRVSALRVTFWDGTNGSYRSLIRHHRVLIDHL